MTILRNAIGGLFGLLFLATTCWAQTAAILPNAKTQFFNANGQPLAGGKVYFCVPNTSCSSISTPSPKTTWQDAFEMTPNAQPVVLDSAGTAFIFGAGNYTEVLYDSAGNLIWSGFTYIPGGVSGVHIFGNDSASGAIFTTAGGVNDALLYETVGGTLAAQTGLSGQFGVTDQNANFLFLVSGPLKQAQGGTTNGNNFSFLSNICSIADEVYNVTGTPTPSETPGFAYKVGATTVNITYTVQPGDTNTTIAAGLALAVKNSSAMAGIINGTCPNGNYYNGTATSVAGGPSGNFDVIYTADPNLAGNSWTALSSANTTISVVPVSTFGGQPGMIWQANIAGRHAVANDAIYVGSYVFQDNTGASATYLTDSMTVLSPTAGAVTFQRLWSGGGCAFDWTISASSSANFSANPCDLHILANGTTTNNVSIASGSAGSIVLNAGSGGIFGSLYYGGSSAGSTLTLTSTASGAPSGDILALHASKIVANTISGTGTAHLQVGNGTVGSLDFANATSGLISLQPPTGGLGNVTLTLPDATDQLVARATTDTLLNKTLASSTDVLGGVTTTLGSDATGDIYYRNSGGQLARLGVCTGTNVVGAAAGLPACVTQTGGLGGAMTYLCTITASASASLNNASPTSGSCPINNSYTSYLLVFQNLVPATNEKIFQLQIHSASGGASYKNSGYLTNNTIFAAAGVNGSQGATTYIPVTFPADANASSLANSAPGFSGWVTLTNPAAAAICIVNVSGTYLNGGGSVTNTMSGGFWNTAAAVDGFQVLMDSGNLTSGSILVYGIT